MYKPIYAKKTKTSKYLSKKCVYNGITFDSKKEMNRYCELLLLQKTGKIKNLRTQEKFVLIPSQYEDDILITSGKNKGKYKKGKLIERECSYYADFVYEDENYNTIVEDTKSPITRTTEYIIKRKLMLYIYHIKIQEI